VRRKLLLADDSVTIQRVVELTFSGEDIDVIAVSDGEQAIARMSTDPPDIVLADIAMPKKNGYEVAAFVKEHPTLFNVPVLLLAGAFEPVDEERARRVKCDGVLVKPFETHDVIARVRELIDGPRRKPTEPPAQVVAAPASVSPPVPAPIPGLAETAVPIPTPIPTPTPAPITPPIPTPTAASTPAPARADESIDDYFDRLDVAFSTRAQSPPRPFPHLQPPTLEPSDASPVFTPPEPAIEGEQRNMIAGLFKAFLEVELGERDAASIQIPDAIERIRRRNTIE
jgi:CheY-like chemotaxis protein